MAAPLLALAAGGAGSSRAAELVAASERPGAGAYYSSGPSGRYLLGGTWLARPDGGVGVREDFEGAATTAGWKPVAVPNAWNAGQSSTASYEPATWWYRKDFTLPAAAAAAAETWIVRFESINNTATVWLNGHELANHAGAFLPFEVALPAADLSRSGVNRLVLRISDAHSLTDLPPASRAGASGVVGGWWNYGGILREVYLRAVDRIDLASVQVLPHLACATCAATVTYSVVAHDYGPAPERVALSSRYGTAALSLGAKTIPAGGDARFSGTLRIAHPQLWSPAAPHLYAVTIDAREARAGGAVLQRYSLLSGVRSVTVTGGRLYLNYRPLDARGVGVIEDSPTAGSALSRAQQRALMVQAKQLGATVVRSQYPLSAYEEQLADQLGIMLWSEVPVYQVHDSELTAVTPAAVALLRENILDNGNHPSIVVWSIANELDPYVGAEQTTYIAEATAAAHALDPTRPVALAFQGFPQVGCQAGYGPLQLLGINDYFGWYPGPAGQIADASLLGAYLDKERACYPRQALMVSEFGAEANRSGPLDERGTYQFQSQFVTQQLSVFATLPWLSGAIYWALSDFQVRPGWDGGNPYPTPPLFTKGLVDFAGAPKPAWNVVQQAYGATSQLG